MQTTPPLWVENDLPTSRPLSTHEPSEHQDDDVEKQIEDFVDAEGSTRTESHDALTDHSHVQEATNEAINLEENVANGGSGIEVGAKVPNVTPPEVQDLD